ncbi:hypothetical protein B0T10DRAFT_536747 [Thelonectria olida]|uniref:DUF7600 domain-containing protein n=1 Tax=Thelonectria olida TaxID=1576542 RepID=A0A9P8WAM3_9HYPO|nr:hypothetical protein B0T10DRAFT_536747 [Thelonectria olida]
MRLQFTDAIPIDKSKNVDISNSAIDETWVKIYLSKSNFDTNYPPEPPIIPQPIWGFPALFDLCRSQPHQLGVMEWGHSYGGLVNYHVHPKELFPGEEEQPRAWGEMGLTGGTDRSDPMEIPHLDQRVVDKNLEESHNTGQEPMSITATINDPFGLLPPELLIDILVRSQSTDVANLFWPGREFEHLFERWRSIYDRVRTSKKRVWALSSRLSDLVAMRLESRVCHGSLCRSVFNPLAADDDRTWLTAHSYFTSVITVEGLTSTAWASLVNINDKNYVSGLRLVQPNGDTVQLRYRHPQHEVAFSWDNRFQVAAEARDYLDVPRESITWTHVEAAKGGFDALKMVYLSIHGPDLDEITQDRQDRNADLGESALWYPGIPDPSLQFLDDGELLLQHLTDINVWIVDRTDEDYGVHTNIWAMELCFNGPTAQTFLKRQYHHVSLDSRNGERITGADSWYDDPETVFAITLHTSYGRCIQIPPDISPIVDQTKVFVEELRLMEATIVGCFSVLKHHKIFQNIGVACIPSSNPGM